METMTSSLHPPLRSFAEFVRATDEDADARLPLLDEAERLLAADVRSDPAVRSATLGRRMGP